MMHIGAAFECFLEGCLPFYFRLYGEMSGPELGPKKQFWPECTLHKVLITALSINTKEHDCARYTTKSLPERPIQQIPTLPHKVKKLFHTLCSSLHLEL